VRFVLRNSATPEKHQIETMAGGVAVFDYNNDDRPDIYFSDGASIPELNKSDAKFWNRLYRNNGDGTFTDVTERAGVAGEGYSMGVAAADYDNDGRLDLFVAGVNRNILYRNRGDGTFEDVTAKAGLAPRIGERKPWSSAAGWFDSDNDGLLDAADKTGLQTKEAILTQADRILGSAVGRESVGNFAAELYQLQVIASRAKDPKFTEYTPALQTAMMQEIPAMFQAIVFDRNASALELLTTRNTFVTKELAALYGLPTTGLSSTALTATTLPADGPRAGLLTTAGLLSLFANQEEGSPTHRGRFIRETILCTPIQLPPANVNTELPDPPAGVVYTRKQKLAMHESIASCALCHKQMDPLGFPLENFDAIGKYRATDQGLTIDLSGELDGTTFTGPVELGKTLAAQPGAADCLVRNIYRYGTGHVETASEQVVLDNLKTSFRTGGYHVRDLMRDIVSSDGFRFVAPPAP